MDERKAGCSGKAYAWIVAGAVVLPWTSSACACDCATSFSDQEMVRSEIAHLDTVSVAIDGIVTRGYNRGFSTIVRPTRVWFGDQQTEYEIENSGDCDPQLRKGQRARLALWRDRSWWTNLSRFLQLNAPLYQASLCSEFAEAMAWPAMQRAVRKRKRAT